ncbi:Phosphorylated CTD interacting factor PCIF1 [Spironucleus salmonicida]|uniref:Phosphorylated CTD interacting factor PCIF1 n=1 Tax=Spironucleus salmonicida TaxID=348837 RepID=V6LNF9_9EUKA|nr:Phosphorylated CTD interacting factor PCIF1 [Spironucleus salmonicida]|eukprot:EST45773.1 Phosphorylated CTD interacting factor PCIF1 [Spironucleus salmonicida]
MNPRQQRYIPILNANISGSLAKSEIELIKIDNEQPLIQELLFAIQINNIREKLNMLVRQKLHIDLPKDTFVQFLYQINQFSSDKNFLVINKLQPENNAIFQELISSIPIKLRSNYENIDKKKLNDELLALQNRSREFLALEDVSIQSQPQNIQNIYSTFKQQIKKYRTDLIPDHFRVKKLTEAKNLNLNFARQRFATVIFEIIEEIYKDINEMNTDNVNSCLDESFVINLVNDQNQPCTFEHFNINQFINNQAKHYIISINPDHNRPDYANSLKIFTQLNKFDQKFIISKNYFLKLVQLYQVSNFDPSFDHFKLRLFILFRRYSSFNGSQFVYSKEQKPKINEGSSFQVSIPPLLYKQLNIQGFTQELFSSPFNTYLSQYYSLFGDVDQYFNSYGNFFSTKIKNIKSVAFLPHNGQFQLACLDKLLELSSCCLFYFQNNNTEFDSQIEKQAKIYQIFTPLTYWLVAGDSFRPNAQFYQQFQFPLIFAVLGDVKDKTFEFVDQIINNVDGLAVKVDEK